MTAAQITTATRLAPAGFEFTAIEGKSVILSWRLASGRIAKRLRIDQAGGARTA